MAASSSAVPVSPTSVRTPVAAATGVPPSSVAWRRRPRRAAVPSSVDRGVRPAVISPLGGEHVHGRGDVRRSARRRPGVRQRVGRGLVERRRLVDELVDGDLVEDLRRWPGASSASSSIDCSAGLDLVGELVDDGGDGVGGRVGREVGDVGVASSGRTRRRRPARSNAESRKPGGVTAAGSTSSSKVARPGSSSPRRPVNSSSPRATSPAYCCCTFMACCMASPMTRTGRPGQRLGQLARLVQDGGGQSGGGADDLRDLTGHGDSVPHNSAARHADVGRSTREVAWPVTTRAEPGAPARTHLPWGHG